MKADPTVVRPDVRISYGEVFLVRGFFDFVVEDPLVRTASAVGGFFFSRLVVSFGELLSMEFVVPSGEVVLAGTSVVPCLGELPTPRMRR